MSAPLAVDFDAGLTNAFSNFFSTLASFIPRLVGFLLILLIGYFIAKAVATVLDKVLERVGFDRAVERGGVAKALSKSQMDASDIVAKLAFYSIFVVALSIAFGTLGIDALAAPLAQLMALLPKILVAIVIFVIGAAIATAAKKFISSALGGLSYGNALGTGVAALIMLLFGKAALDEVGIAEQVTGAVLITLLATAGGIAVVGIGGGLIKPMQQRWEQGLTKAGQEKDNVKQQMQSQQGGQQGGQQYAQQYGQPYPTDPNAQPAAGAPTATYGTAPGYAAPPRY